MAAVLGCHRRGIILLILYINLCLIHQISAQLKSDCTNTIGNYTQNSVFQVNLNGMVSSVKTNMNSNGFWSGTAGQGDDQVHGIANCRGDIINSTTCGNCVDNAARNLTITLCPNQKEGIVWYDLCMFRYSNNSIQGVVNTVALFRFNTGQSSDANSFTNDLSLLADNLINNASAGNQRKFAQGQSNNNNNPNVPTIYGYMQCTPDISSSDCKSCLNSTLQDVSSCCSNNLGAVILTPSCIFHFEITPFLNQPSDPPALPPLPPPPPPPSSTSTGKRSKSKTAIIAVGVIIVLLVLTLGVCVFITRRRWRKAHKQEEEAVDDDDFDGITQYNFDLISAATEGFSTANMLGRGGFGEVYKGVLSDGKEIAVKRLSTTSGQGETEFRNEVKLLAKLQHKCLVKLLGFCLQQKERLLIYEFMANGSLDNFLFDPENRSRLDWEERFIIIKSIAKGLLYLHEDSRLMIIHRDLKASNILLDKEMNAKISDLGMARLFVLDEDEGVTKRIAGTFGYMAPEYAMHGLFSVKSDVYSYGVLLLEIVSGKRNSSSLTEDSLKDLPSRAYKTWKEGKASDLVDPMLTVDSDSDSLENMMRCLHIALLCVQENVGSRPTMAAVVLMLQSLTLILPAPSEPGFYSNAEMIVPQWSLFMDFTESSSSSSQSKPILPHVGARSERALNVESYSHKHLR